MKSHAAPKATLMMLLALIVAVIVMVVVDVANAQQQTATTSPTTTATTTTTTEPSVVSKEKKLPLTKDAYTKMVQNLDSLMKKLHNQKLVVDKEVNDAKAELELAMKEEAAARKQVEALQKEFLISKKRTEELGTTVKELVGKISKAQVSTQSALSKYNRIVVDGPKQNDLDALKKDKKTVSSVHEKMQKLIDARKKVTMQ